MVHRRQCLALLAALLLVLQPIQARKLRQEEGSGEDGQQVEDTSLDTAEEDGEQLPTHVTEAEDSANPADSAAPADQIEAGAGGDASSSGGEQSGDAEPVPPADDPPKDGAQGDGEANSGGDNNGDYAEDEEEGVKGAASGEEADAAATDFADSVSDDDAASTTDGEAVAQPEGPQDEGTADEEENAAEQEAEAEAEAEMEAEAEQADGGVEASEEESAASADGEQSEDIDAAAEEAGDEDLDAAAKGMAMGDQGAGERIGDATEAASVDQAAGASSTANAADHQASATMMMAEDAASTGSDATGSPGMVLFGFSAAHLAIVLAVMGVLAGSAYVYLRRRPTREAGPSSLEIPQYKAVMGTPAVGGPPGSWDNTYTGNPAPAAAGMGDRKASWNEKW